MYNIIENKKNMLTYLFYCVIIYIFAKDFTLFFQYLLLILYHKIYHVVVL